MNVGCFSLLVSLIVFIVVSFLTSRADDDKLPADVRAVMEI